ncbi:hypothetical protein [Mucilaginibacter sp. L196]|uniref:hypothetical protein n=1 Tax=Mucilaginibacter sp. L196 TaxID=1641870 RepID=UPI00131C21E6|nr:hypothetical protein [Mucilaginibacter sp. L196]
MSTTNKSNFSITTKSKLNYVLALINIFIICVFALKLKDIGLILFHFSIGSPYNFNSPLVILAFYIIAIYCIYNLLFMLTGETTFTINNNILTVNKKIAGISRAKNYNIDQIQNPRIETVGSSTRWGFQGFYFRDYTMDVLVFSYNNSKIMLGKNLDNFNAQELKDAVKSI